MGIEIKKRDCTIHRRIGSAAQQAQQTAAVGKSSYRPTRVRYRTTVVLIVAHTHTRVRWWQRRAWVIVSRRPEKGWRSGWGGAPRTICFVSDIIIPPIFRWQSSTLARNKWIEKYISTHKRPFDFEYDLALSGPYISLLYVWIVPYSFIIGTVTCRNNNIFLECWEAQAEATGSLFNHFWFLAFEPPHKKKTGMIRTQFSYTTSAGFDAKENGYHGEALYAKRFL